DPIHGSHIAAVDRALERDGPDLHFHARELGHLVLQGGEVHGLQRVGARIETHADGAAGVDQQDLAHDRPSARSTPKSRSELRVVISAISSTVRPVASARRAATYGM